MTEGGGRLGCAAFASTNSEDVQTLIAGNGPVTLLRMRTTYELRVLIIELTFIRATYAKNLLKIQNCVYIYRILTLVICYV